MSNTFLIATCAVVAAASAAVVATTDATADWQQRLDPAQLLSMLLPSPNPARPTSRAMVQLQATERAEGRGSRDDARIDVRTASIPVDGQLLYLIRSHLVALDHANQTANYSVLRDLAAPAFQQRNDAQKLSQSFANLRRAGLSLSPAVSTQPLLVDGPRRTPDDLLRLTGSIPTPERAIDFDMHFQAVRGHWRLYGLQVGARRLQTATTQPRH